MSEKPDLVKRRLRYIERQIALDTGEYLQLYPHRHGCDGFFAAVLVRDA